jgi:hypothetical protein
MRTARLLRTSVALLALVATGCDWVTFHAGPNRAGWQPVESTIGVGNVAQLRQARSYPGAATPPVVVEGVLYSLDGQGYLHAFDATGGAGCTGSPIVCSPLWSSSTAAGRSLTVDSGKVYAVGMSGLNVYDAAGVTGCSGSPKVCGPLWTTGTFVFIGPGAPAVVNGVVYVTGTRPLLPLPGGAYVIAYDARGSTNCTAGVCSPLWSSTAAPTDLLYQAPLAVANGMVYAAEGTGVAGFDASGSTACTGTPKVCSPLWTATTPTQLSSLAYGGPAVANGTLFVAGLGGTLYAFDASGNNGCGGAPRACSPLWTASVGDTRTTPAIANGTVYVTNALGTLQAFDAMGVNGCSGSPKVCTPLWRYAPNVSGFTVTGLPAGANGVVYTVSPDSTFHALDAAGTTNCSGSPKLCDPLWSTATGDIASDSSPAIVNGTVYWNTVAVSTTWAYSL